MRSDTNHYQALTPADWLAYESCLNGLLRVREPPELTETVEKATAILQQIQTLIVHRAWRWPLQQVPLMLCRGPARSGAVFLRWRNQQNNRSGMPGWAALMQDPTQPLAVRQSLLAIEHDRITFNMQMSIKSFISRQLRECTAKLSAANNIAAAGYPPKQEAIWPNVD